MNMYPGYPTNTFAQGAPVAPQAPKTGNWLSAEKYALLQKGLGQFKLSVTEEELAKGQCNHYYTNGTSALIPDSDGSGGCTCAICGTHFTSHDFTADEVKVATDNVLDILNTIKIMYLSIDPNAALEYFQIIPFIEKIPALYGIAANDFKKYEGINTYTPNQMNPFGAFAMMMGMPGYAPVYQQPQAAPMGGVGYQVPQQPVMNGFAQQNPGFNPLYGGMPTQPVAYQPQQPGYAFNPQGAAAQPMMNTNMPVQPQTAAPATEEVKVDTQFKK